MLGSQKPRLRQARRGHLFPYAECQKRARCSQGASESLCNSMVFEETPGSAMSETNGAPERVKTGTGWPCELGNKIYIPTKT